MAEQAINLRGVMKPSCASAGLMCAGALLMLSACTEETNGEPPAPKPVRALDAGERPVDASLVRDAAPSDSGTDSSLDAGSDAGERVRPRVGINLRRSPSELDAGGPAAGETLLQELELLALGVEATHFTVQNSAGIPAAAARLSARGVSVAANVEIVSGRRALLSGLPESWSVNELVAGFELVFAEPLSAEYLAIGSGLDLYWQESQKADRAAFSEFVVESITAARNHAAKPSGLKIGFETRLQAWLGAESEQALRQWAAVSDFVGISWLPLDSDGLALGPDAALSQLTDVLARTRDLKIPVLLLQVAYPGARAQAGASGRQATFYEKLFDMLQHEDHAVPFLAVSALNDPSPPECAAAGADFGPRNPGPFTEAWCATGLRDRYSTPKPAYSSVIEGLARFSSR